METICTTCDYIHPEGYCPIEEGGTREDQRRFWLTHESDAPWKYLRDEENE